MTFSLPKDDPELVPVYIEHAILRYGHTDPDRARDYMGEMAWFVITETGGWLHACGLNHDDMVHYRSVWRLVAKKILVIPKEDGLIGKNYDLGLTKENSETIRTQGIGGSRYYDDNDCTACKGRGVDWHLKPDAEGTVYHCVKCNREFVE